MLALFASAKQYAKDLYQSRSWPDRPEKLAFEITAACDARCVHCPRLDMDRPMKAMPTELFRKLVDGAAELGVPYLCLNGYGEICTIPIPALEDYLDYIAAAGSRFKILINTNGNRMTEERIRLFVKHKVHLINITIDGATATTAESIRVNLDFDQIEANVKQLIAIRNAAGLTRPMVRVGMIAMDQTIPEWGAFQDRWRGIADHVGMGGFSSRLASVGPPDDRADLVQLGKPSMPAPSRSACVLPFRDLNIWADGKAVLCCEDWNEEFIVGDLSHQSIREIWHSPRMTEVRKKHIGKLGHEISQCAKCNQWHKASAGARLWS